MHALNPTYASLQPYDIAAGVLILREAGGAATRFDGSQDVLEPPCEVVSANPKLHPRMIEVLQNGN